MKQTPISARIDPEVLEYIKGCHQPVHTLINTLLLEWMNKRQAKELLLFQETTGTDEFSKLKERHTEKNNQCCYNCIYNKNSTTRVNCKKTEIVSEQLYVKTFCCIYWEKKKERH